MNQRFALVFGVCFALVFPLYSAFAQSATRPNAVSAAVLQMQSVYQKTFPDLPKMRKCTPEDVLGEWRAVLVKEWPIGFQTKQWHETGPKYLGFGEYNRFVVFRSKVGISKAAVKEKEANTPLQYIVTAHGVIYVYRDNKFRYSQLCFIAEENSLDYKAGQLFVASLVVANQPVEITVFERLP